jgi:hypothetical protein
MDESISVYAMTPFPAKANPFHHDKARMGIRLGTNVIVMFSNHPTERMQDLVVYNQSTGARALIQFWQ